MSVWRQRLETVKEQTAKFASIAWRRGGRVAWVARRGAEFAASPSCLLDARARNTDAFNTSLREIAEYIARNVTNGGKFMQALDPDQALK